MNIAHTLSNNAIRGAESVMFWRSVRDVVHYPEGMRECDEAIKEAEDDVIRMANTLIQCTIDGSN